MKYKYLALAPIAMTGALLRQNKKIKVTTYTLPFKNLPIDFNNYKIAHVSDIHCDKVGYSDLSFLNKLKKINKNIISLLFLKKYVILIIGKMYFDNKSLILNLAGNHKF